MATTNAAEMIIGPAFITFGGVEMGFTTDDGAEFTEEFNLVKAEAPQSLVVFGAYRDKFTCSVKASFTQLSLEKWALISDYNNTPSNGSVNIAVNPTPTARQLIITCSGGNGKTRTMTVW